jgi:hypothetical protein
MPLDNPICTYSLFRDIISWKFLAFISLTT